MIDTTLAQRLRDYRLTLEENVVICDRRVVDEAADELDRLTADNKALTEKVQELENDLRIGMVNFDAAEAKLAKALEDALRVGEQMLDQKFRADRLSAELAEARKELELARKLEPTVGFVARMAWRTDPPHSNAKLTDTERLSAIKFHPIIKHFGKPHIELAEREALASKEASHAE